MSTLIFEVPEDSDFWPCPEGCGRATEDPAGGPCKACWQRITRRCPGCDARPDEPHDAGCHGGDPYFPESDG